MQLTTVQNDTSSRRAVTRAARGSTIRDSKPLSELRATMQEQRGALWAQNAYPKEWVDTWQKFFQDAGALCVVFGFIEHYLERGKKLGTRLGARNFDVVAIGILFVIVSVVLASKSLPNVSVAAASPSTNPLTNTKASK
jgi:hypothetical protein